MTVSAFVRPFALLLFLAVAPAFGAEAVLLESLAPDSPEETAGSVKWVTAVGDDGLMVLKGHVVIGKGEVTAEVTFRRLTDPDFPSDYAIDVAFDLGGDFEGGRIEELPGIMVRMDVEQGAPVEGGSARVVGNVFIFAAKQNGNVDILTTGNWIDFAIIYATGQRAILGLGVDETARDALADMLL